MHWLIVSVVVVLHQIHQPVIIIFLLKKTFIFFIISFLSFWFHYLISVFLLVLKFSNEQFSMWGASNDLMQLNVIQIASNYLMRNVNSLFTKSLDQNYYFNKIFITTTLVSRISVLINNCFFRFLAFFLFSFSPNFFFTPILRKIAFVFVNYFFL